MNWDLQAAVAAIPDVPTWLNWILALIVLIGFFAGPSKRFLVWARDSLAMLTQVTARARAEELAKRYLRLYAAYRDTTEAVTLAAKLLAELVAASVFFLIVTFIYLRIDASISENLTKAAAFFIALAFYFRMRRSFSEVQDLWGFNVYHPTMAKRILELWRRAGLSEAEVEQQRAWLKKPPALPTTRFEPAA